MRIRIELLQIGFLFQLPARWSALQHETTIPALTIVENTAA
jgi:hypothetical protein